MAHVATLQMKTSAEPHCPAGDETRVKLEEKLSRPNLPLRKPMSAPISHLSMLTPAANGQMSLAATKDPTSGFFFNQTSGKVNLCGYCGHEGSFFCTRCKKMSYCSVTCQTEDWKAHRHMCQPFEAEASQPAALSPKSKLYDPTSRSRMYLKDLTLKKVVKGEEFKATVMEFYSPGQFFLITNSQQVMEALQNISRELQKTKTSSIPYIPDLGEICVVQFSNDMQWYRGQVLILDNEKKTADILYIDFGNKETVPVNRIRPLIPNVTKFSPCAMECYVAGVDPVASDWSTTCLTVVGKLLKGQNVTARIVETNGHSYGVDIVVSSGQLLSSFLLEHNHGKKLIKEQSERKAKSMMASALDNVRNFSNGQDETCFTQLPKSPTPEVGSSLSVVVIDLQSPNEILVQNVANAGLIQDLQLKIMGHCSLASKVKNFRPSPGSVCCAQFSGDKQWYRAKVLNYSSEQHLFVFYIDFGNTEDVHLANVKPISPALLSLPVQALTFSLAGVQPVGGNWTEDCLHAFKQRFSNRILEAKILDMQNGKPLVTLTDQASDPETNVADILISAGYASDAPAVPTIHQQENQDNVSNGVNVPLKWPTIEFPKNGHRVAVLSSVVYHPGDFYCYMNSPADEQRQLQMSAELKRHCEKDLSPFMPKVGEPCCAMCPSDGSWYRAIILSQTKEKLKVNFVDYGYILMIDRSHVRSITPQLLTLPFDAVHCCLTGVAPLGSEWSSEAIIWFQNLLVGEQLFANVINVTPQGYGLELECSGQNVAAALISKQLAKASPIIRDAGKNSEVSHLETPNKPAHKRLPEPITDLKAPTVALSSGDSFPVDWKTFELPLNMSFTTRIAAIISPKLFFLLGHNKVDKQKLAEVMAALAQYSCEQKDKGPAFKYNTLVPGAACCAQFTADHKWYRAVVLKVGQNGVEVIYADYGNRETVPMSNILPIPSHLLHLPFAIARCSLDAGDLCGADWPECVTERFQKANLKNALATVRSFEGSTNILSLSMPAEMGGGDLTTFLMDSLPNGTQRVNSPTLEKSDEGSKKNQEQSVPQIPSPRRTSIQMNDGCCCEHLKSKIEHLEMMMMQMLSHLTDMSKEKKLAFI